MDKNSILGKDKNSILGKDKNSVSSKRKIKTCQYQEREHKNLLVLGKRG